MDSENKQRVSLYLDKQTVKTVDLFIVEFNEDKNDSVESLKTLEEGLQNWLQVFKFPAVERTTYDRAESIAKNQGQRTDLTSSPVATKLGQGRSDTELAEQVGESKDTIASREDKEEMFLEYSELLNSFDSGATTKITINNRRLNRLDFEKSILIPLKGDALDVYRDEYNKMLLDKATGANSMVQDKYITVSVCKKNIEEARTYFNRVGNDMITHLSKLGSQCIELEAEERLRIFQSSYLAGLPCGASQAGRA